MITTIPPADFLSLVWVKRQQLPDARAKERAHPACLSRESAKKESDSRWAQRQQQQQNATHEHEDIFLKKKYPS